MSFYDHVQELLDYDPATGKFYNRVARGGLSVGAVVGTMTGAGYVELMIDNERYLAHRLAWFYVHGYFPENDIDHIDRNPKNNQILNLREVSRSCNLRNCGNPKSNKSGVKGVHWHKPSCMWQAQITVGDRHRALGYYHDFDDAVCARLAAEQCLGWEGCDSSSPAYQYVRNFANDAFWK